MAIDMQQVPLFDYEALDIIIRSSLQQRAEKIRSYSRRYVVEVGRELAEARDELRHNKAGGFEGWVALEFGWSRRTAYNFISAYEAFGNCANFAQLEIADSAIYLLAPASEDIRNEAIQRAEAGEKISYAVAKGIIKPHKPQTEKYVEENINVDTEFEPPAYTPPRYESPDWTPTIPSPAPTPAPMPASHYSTYTEEDEEQKEETEEDRYQTAVDIGALIDYCDELMGDAIQRNREERETRQVQPEPGHFMPLMSSSETPEWYTPLSIIERVQSFFGEIDLDPCSNSHEAPNVPARTLYTKEDDGLAQSWHGRTYMNPPYGSEISKWVKKLLDEYKCGNVQEALTLVPGRIDTSWFQPLYAHLICALKGRVQFIGASTNSAPFPSVIVYLGPRQRDFIEAFEDMGPIITKVH